MDDSQILRLDLELEEDKHKEGALQVLKFVRPEWKPEDVKFKVFTDGISNKLVGCYLGDDKRKMILVRIFGKKSELLINRKLEEKAFQVLFKAGLGPQLYATFKNGISYEFLPGNILSTKSVRDDKVFPLIARECAKMHHIVPDSSAGFSSGPVLFPKLWKWLKTLPKEYEDPAKNEIFKRDGPSHETLSKELTLLESILPNLGSPVVFTHHDLLLANVIHDEKENKVYFIDYEYAAYNYQGFDIGNHFNEFAGVEEVDYTLYPEKEFQLRWIREYLTAWHEIQGIKEPVTDIDVERQYVIANKFSLASNFFWGIWGLIQAHHSTIDFDFLGYGLIRLNQYFKTKDEFLALQMPK